MAIWAARWRLWRMALSLRLARGSDGYPDFLGAPDDLEMRFAGRTIRPANAPIADAIVGGMAQPFYITPPVIHGETYFDGGGAYYDIGLFPAAMEREPILLLDLHFAEPPNHSYGLDERPNLVRILFDTHNFTLPEDRRRMRRMVNLFYDYVSLRRRMGHLVDALQCVGHQAILARHDLPDLTGNWQRAWQAEFDKERTT